MRNNPKKQLIIKAAQKRFIRHGLSKTTVEEIARDLRIGKATVYHYFNSKEEIFYEVLKIETERYLESISLLLSNPESGIDVKLREYFLFKRNLREGFPLLNELLYLIINERAIEGELELFRSLLDKEELLIGEVLNDMVKKKPEIDMAKVLIFQSFGYLFTSLMQKVIYGGEIGAEFILPNVE